MSAEDPDVDRSDSRWSFVDQLVRMVPGWEDIWIDDRGTYGRQAPEAFLRTVAYLTGSRIAAGRVDDDLPVDQTFAFLESGFGTDPLIDSMIAGSFLSKLPRLTLLGPDPIPRLGPTLRAELERHRAGGGIPVATPGPDFVNELTARHAAVAEVLREHLADEEDELLPHVFMADLVRAAIGWLNTPLGRASVASVMASFEDVYGHDYEVDELIATGFVENLPYPHDAGAQLLTMLGPKLRAEYNLERPAHQIQ